MRRRKLEWHPTSDGHMGTDGVGIVASIHGESEGLGEVTISFTIYDAETARDPIPLAEALAQLIHEEKK